MNYTRTNNISSFFNKIDLRLIGMFLINIVGAMELDIFTPSIPEIRDFFNIPVSTVQLLISLNFIAYAIATIIIGPISDKYGAKFVMTISLWVFFIGSLFCVISSNFSILLLGRLLQGIGMSAPNALIYVIVFENYPDKKEVYSGMLMGVGGMAMGIAPVLGNTLNDFFGWQSNFVFLLAMGAICLLFANTFKKTNISAQEKASLKNYEHVIVAKKFWKTALPMLFLVTGYFIFISMASIIYKEEIKINPHFYGIYIGILASCFGIMSFFSPILFKKYTKEKCFTVSFKINLMAGIVLILYTIFGNMNPIVLTALLCIESMSACIPISVNYPLILESVKNHSSKCSSLTVALRLGLSALGVQLIATIFSNYYKPVLIFAGLTNIFGYIFGKKLLKLKNK